MKLDVMVHQNNTKKQLDILINVRGNLNFTQQTSTYIFVSLLTLPIIFYLVPLVTPHPHPYPPSAHPNHCVFRGQGSGASYPLLQEPWPETRVDVITTRCRGRPSRLHTPPPRHVRKNRKASELALPRAVLPDLVCMRPVIYHLARTTRGGGGGESNKRTQQKTSEHRLA